MSAHAVIDALWLATWTGSLAILAVLALRGVLRKRFGAGIAYAAWGLVPATWLALLLPARVVVVPIRPVTTTVLVDALPAAPMVEAFDPMPLLAGLWLLGVLVTAAWMARQQSRFVRGMGALEVVDADAGVLRAQSTAGLPALVGLLQPRIVLPADVDTRYVSEERGLMLAHERAHLCRGDLWINAVVAVVRCLQWFNPLVHAAASRLRHDQELACDERVVADHPQSRRAYADAMLKTLVAEQPVPLGCHWGITHPMKERIMMLKQQRPARRTRLAGAVLIGLAALATGFAAWSAQPATVQAGTTLPGSEQADFNAQIAFSRNGGAPARFVAMKPFGESFTMTDGTAAGNPSVTAVVQPVLIKGALGHQLQLRVVADGKVVSEPRMVVRDGGNATMQMGEERNGRFSGITLKVMVSARDAQSALKQAKPFVPSMPPAPPAPPEPPKPAAVPAPPAPPPPAKPERPISGRMVSLSLSKMPVREAAQVVAQAVGMRIANPEVLPMKAVSFNFNKVPVEAAFQLMADETGHGLKVTGDVVQFVPNPANAERPATTFVERRVVTTAPAGQSLPVAGLKPEVQSAIGKLPEGARVTRIETRTTRSSNAPMPASAAVHGRMKIVRDSGTSKTVDGVTLRTQVVLETYEEVVRAGGRALGDAEAVQRGLSSEFRWIDVQPLVATAEPNQLTISSDVFNADEGNKNILLAGYKR